MTAYYNQPTLFGTNAERLAYMAAHPGSQAGQADALGGVRWFETDTSDEFVWDWISQTWVQTTGGGAPSGAAGGDLTGTYPNPTVDALLGRALGLDAPSEGQVLMFTGSAWRPRTISEGGGGGAPSGPAGGDLTGTYPNPTVDGLLGRPLGLDAVAEGYLLTYTGTAWRPMPAGVFPGVATPTGPAGGDLTGTYPNPTVDGLLGRPLALNAPGQGNVLMYTGTAWQPAVMMAPAGVAVYYASGAQSLANDTAIAFDAERRDDAAFHDAGSNTRLTVPAGYAGWYSISGNVRYAGSALGTIRGVIVRLNGATSIAQLILPLAGLATVFTIAIGCIYYLAAGDYVELITQQDTGGNLNVNQVSNVSPEFRMVRVGP